MKSEKIRRGEYIEIRKKNGTLKVLPFDVYRRRRKLKKIGSVLLLLAAMPLICGAAACLGRPEKAFAIMVMCALALAIVFVCIIVGGDEE